MLGELFYEDYRWINADLLICGLRLINADPLHLVLHNRLCVAGLWSSFIAITRELKLILLAK